MKDKYKDLTKEDIEKVLKDMMYDSSKNDKRRIVLHCFGTIDDDGNVHCGFMEDFDKAMKESVKKL